MEKIIVISRKTRLDSLVVRFNTRQQAQFYVERLGGDFSDYEREHQVYYQALEKLVSHAEQFGNVQVIDWKFLPNFIFGPHDLVLTVGQDGLVANALKYLESQKLIGFNSDPSRWDGTLSNFQVEEALKIIPDSFENKSLVKQITKAKVVLSDGQALYAVNDFFIGIKNHSSARYIISAEGKSEYHSSSGVIISTPLGASGWMKSIVEGAAKIVGGLEGKPHELQQKIPDWSEDTLTYAVREPFPSVNTKTDLVFGKVNSRSLLKLESKMGDDGFIFSDGVQDDFLNFNYSIIASFGLAETKGSLVVKAKK
ncbi:MAG TPA: sugar kinase [Spirochaetia bacterium]|nr:MAG: sugar kinase [Spirochaetes bacterium GWB1_36_13]HCL56004.1 sugar kinase [Spirochaetia bacterium]